MQHSDQLRPYVPPSAGKTGGHAEHPGWLFLALVVVLIFFLCVA